MNEGPKNNSADLVGHVLDATNRLAKSRRRVVTLLVVVLLIAIAVLGVYVGNLRSANDRKDAAANTQQATITALTKKSAEQTVAEVQLRDDVNRLSELQSFVEASHTKSLAVFCSIAVTLHDDLPAVASDCPK